MLQRRLRVCAVHATEVELLPAPRCDGCSQCSERCSGLLSGLSAQRPLIVGRHLLPAVSAGDELLLSATPAAIGRASRKVHGRVLLGVLLGAAVGAGLAIGSGAPIDTGVAIGVGVGVAMALWRGRDLAIPRGFLLSPFPITRQTNSESDYELQPTFFPDSRLGDSAGRDSPAGTCRVAGLRTTG